MFNRHSRREFLGAGLVSTLGLALSPTFQRLVAKETSDRRAKACILIWLNGGPSHVDTFDLKPDGPSGYKTTFKAIDTAAPGVKISEHLPLLAKQAKHMAIIRTLTSKEADHDIAYRNMHIGNKRDETVDYPSFGSVAAHGWTGEESDLPGYVAINGSTPPGAGFLGIEYSPQIITNLDSPLENLTLPEGVGEDRLDRRLKALEMLNQGFTKRSDPRRVADNERFVEKALKLRKSPALAAFDLSKEKPETIQAYTGSGQDSTFARACVLARRLVEAKVPFIEVQLDGWDTHGDNFRAVAGLSQRLDPALAGLTADLNDRGMLKDTLIVCMGEFGRTPKINPGMGRDHHAEAYSAVLIGSNVKGGQVVGETDAKGETVKDRPVTIPDFYATLLHAIGLDGKKQYRTPNGRPIRLADKGEVVKEVF
jgi:hypothetical protein